METIINNMEDHLIVIQDKLIELNDDALSTTDAVQKEVLRCQISSLILNMKMIKAAIKELEQYLQPAY